MNTLAKTFPQPILTPTLNNEVAVVFNMGLANFEYGTKPTERRYQSNHQSVAVIYENTSDGVAKANAHLLSYFMKYIEPEDIDGELRERMAIPLLRERDEPFSSIKEYKTYLQSLGFGIGSCGFVGVVFGHALTDNEELSTAIGASGDYMNEFTEVCSFSAVGIDSTSYKKEQLNQLYIHAMRHPKELEGFLLPVHIIDCLSLGQPLIQAEWITESLELDNGLFTPCFELIELIPEK